MNSKKKYLLLIIVSIFFLSIGYASINNVSLDLLGLAISESRKTVLIESVTLADSSNINEENTKINSNEGTLLNTQVSLGDDISSFVTYEITFYNNSSYAYHFREATFDKEFYDNENITFTISDIDTSSIINSKERLTAKITFKYAGDTVPDNHVLNSCINFVFQNPSTVVKKDIISNIVGSDDTSKLETIDIDSMPEEDRKNMFSNVANESGLFKVKGITGEEAYAFRGNVTNNYVYFATYWWRILQIDENGNLRIILDDSINANKYNSTSTMTSIEEAKKILNYDNSLAKDTVANWVSTFTGYEDKIKISKFCIDFNYITMTSSQSKNTVHYFQSYQNVGPDSGVYDPGLTCKKESIYENSSGLITADEYVLAGGAFNKANTNFFLYNSATDNSVWTMSPAFYDVGRSNGNVFIIDKNGTLLDWSFNLLTQYYSFRPVITIDGNTKMLGTGTKSDPYIYEDASKVAAKESITDISSLNNKKYYLASLNSSKAVYGVLTKEESDKGLRGTNSVYFNSYKEKITVIDAEELSFVNGEETSDGYTYEILNENGEYLTINTDNTIRFSNEKTKLKVKLATDEKYQGQIYISNLDETMYLNFYGSESHTNEDMFAGWEELDKNAYLTLYKLETFGN